MTTLRWPDDRGKFTDRDADRIAGVSGSGDAPLTVYPGETIDVSDPEVESQYRDRGFEAAGGDDSGGADGSDASEDADESAEGDGFDAEAFTDRTPVSKVVDDIEAGEADGHLDAVAEADDRVTVQDAVESRQDDAGGE